MLVLTPASVTLGDQQSGPSMHTGPWTAPREGLPSWPGTRSGVPPRLSQGQCQPPLLVHVRHPPGLSAAIPLQPLLNALSPTPPHQMYCPGPQPALDTPSLTTETSRLRG